MFLKCKKGHAGGRKGQNDEFGFQNAETIECLPNKGKPNKTTTGLITYIGFSLDKNDSNLGEKRPKGQIDPFSGATVPPPAGMLPPQFCVSKANPCGGRPKVKSFLSEGGSKLMWGVALVCDLDFSLAVQHIAKKMVYSQNRSRPAVSEHVRPRLGRVIHGPMPVPGETLDELPGPLVHADLP